MPKSPRFRKLSFVLRNRHFILSRGSRAENFSEAEQMNMFPNY